MPMYFTQKAEAARTPERLENQTMIIIAIKFIFVTPEPGEPGRCERFVGDLSELENTEEGGEPEQDHHGLHQDEPGFKVKSQGKLLLTAFYHFGHLDCASIAVSKTTMSPASAPA